MDMFTYPCGNDNKSILVKALMISHGHFSPKYQHMPHLWLMRAWYTVSFLIQTLTCPIVVIVHQGAFNIITKSKSDKFYILFQISLKFVPYDNKLALIRVWPRPEQAT